MYNLFHITYRYGNQTVVKQTLYTYVQLCIVLIHNRIEYLQYGNLLTYNRATVDCLSSLILAIFAYVYLSYFVWSDFLSNHYHWVNHFKVYTWDINRPRFITENWTINSIFRCWVLCKSQHLSATNSKDDMGNWNQKKKKIFYSRRLSSIIRSWSVPMVQWENTLLKVSVLYCVVMIVHFIICLVNVWVTSDIGYSSYHSGSIRDLCGGATVCRKILAWHILQWYKEEV